MLNNIKISEIMTTDLITVKVNEMMDVVKTKLQENNIHHILVVDERGTLKGILSENDLIILSHHLTVFNNDKEQKFNEKYLKTVYVSEIMQQQFVNLEANDTVGMAADIFRENLFHAIPITEGNKLVGIITTYDLINYAYRAPYLVNQ